MKKIKRLHVLLAILALSFAIFIYRYEATKSNLFPATAGETFDTSKKISDQNSKGDTQYIKYTVSTNCPKGTDKMLQDSKVKVEYPRIECELADEKYTYYSEEIKIWRAMYGSVLVGGDVQLGKSLNVMQKPDGSLMLDPGLAGLQKKVIDNAKKNIQGKIGDTGDHVNHSINELNRYIELQGLVYGPNEKGQYCGDFNALAPLSGTFTICQEFGDEYEEVNDKARYISGIPVYLAARELAKELTRFQYLSKVDYKNEVSDYMSEKERDKLGTGTFLADYILKWRYHTTGGGYWTFVIRERQAGGKYSPPDKVKGFDDMLLVKVQNDKKACILETSPYAIRGLSLDDNDTPCK